MLKDYDIMTAYYWLYWIYCWKRFNLTLWLIPINKFQILLDRISHIVKLGDVVKRLDNV